MIQLWSVWNFSWFLLGTKNIVPFNNSLKSSIFVTSILGGYMIYIYPRKISIKFGNYKIKPSYPCLIAGDLIIHQIPMVYVLYLGYDKKPMITNESCGAGVLIPFSGWVLVNKLLGTNVDKIYGIKMKYLITSATILFAGQTLCHHYFKKSL